MAHCILSLLSLAFALALIGQQVSADQDLGYKCPGGLTNLANGFAPSATQSRSLI